MQEPSERPTVGPRPGERFSAYVARVAAEREARARRPEQKGLVAGFVAQQADSEERRAQVRTQEAERDRKAAEAAASERRAKRDAAARAAGKVLMRMAPGRPWWPEWVREFLQPSVPGLTPSTLPPGLGNLALAYGLAVLKDRDVAGRATKNREAFVVACAKRVQAGERTIWSSQASAAAFPHLVVSDQSSQDGGELEEGEAAAWDAGDSASWRAKPGYEPATQPYRPPEVGNISDYRGKVTKYGPGPLLPSGGLSKFRRRQPGED